MDKGKYGADKKQHRQASKDDVSIFLMRESKIFRKRHSVAKKGWKVIDFFNDSPGGGLQEHILWKGRQKPCLANAEIGGIKSNCIAMYEQSLVRQHGAGINAKSVRPLSGGEVVIKK